MSDDGHDDTITVNHFMSFSKEQYVEVISTYFHPKFQCYPTDTELNCQWADLGDQVLRLGGCCLGVCRTQRRYGMG